MRGLFRVAAYFSVGLVACGLFGAKSARAELTDSTLELGRQMASIARSSSNNEVTTILFNEQKMNVGSSVSTDEPNDILGRFEDYCKANTGQFPTNAFAEADKDSPKEAKKTGFMRLGNEREGAVLCFVKGPDTKATAKEAFETFLATGELGSFGELRYVYASKGQSGSTLVLTAWTDSKFNFIDLACDDSHDCPGRDFAEVPRVPSSHRIISASAADKPYGVNVYRTGQSAGEVLRYYDREMHQLGWFTYDPEMTEEEHKGQGRAYMKNGVVVTVGTSTDGGETFVALGLSGVAADEGKLGRRD